MMILGLCTDSELLNFGKMSRNYRNCINDNEKIVDGCVSDDSTEHRENTANDANKNHKRILSFRTTTRL